MAKEPVIIKLSRISDPRGDLSFIEYGSHIHFNIDEVEILFPQLNVDLKYVANTVHQSIFIALAGSIEVAFISDGKLLHFKLNRPDLALFIPEGTNISITRFSKNLVLSLITGVSSHGEKIKDKTSAEYKPVTGENSKIKDCLINDVEQVFDNSFNGLILKAPAVCNDISIKRLYYLYNVPAGSERGGHAHRDLYQLLIAIRGSFDVNINDGSQSQTIKLDYPAKGLLIVPGIWRELSNFSADAICLVIASEVYFESDYIRDFGAFMIYKGKV